MSEIIGKCRVPMWGGGIPAGFCGEPAYGEQYPRGCELHPRAWRDDLPYCPGPCCHMHGGPDENDIRVYQDGNTKEERSMWCAVFPDFENLQESPAGFSGNPNQAVANLRAAKAMETGTAKTEGLGPKDESAVAESDLPEASVHQEKDKG